MFHAVVGFFALLGLWFLSATTAAAAPASLLAEAGYASGLKLHGIAPFPPYYEMAERLATEEYLAVPLYINSFVHAIGPRVLPADDSFHTYWSTPQVGFPWSWEDWEVKS
jgi:hypothetical protein